MLDHPDHRLAAGMNVDVLHSHLLRPLAPVAIQRAGRWVQVSTKLHAVRVMIGGEEYTVRSDLPPEYTREVAAYVDQALKKVLSQGPLVETHKAAILAALDITNELFQAKKGEREVAARLAAVTDDLAKMLPPGKRKVALGH